MVGEACLPSNAYYPRTPDYTLYSGVHACWSGHSDSSFVYGFMSLDYGLGTMPTTTFRKMWKGESVDICKQCGPRKDNVKWGEDVICLYKILKKMSRKSLSHRT